MKHLVEMSDEEYQTFQDKELIKSENIRLFYVGMLIGFGTSLLIWFIARGI